jgi:hypothetical protein
LCQKEESAKIMRRKIRLARGGRGIAGGEYQVAKPVQVQASPAVLCRKTPEAQGLKLAERESALRRHLPEAHGAVSFNPCDGREEALAAAGEFTKSTKNETKNSVRLGSVPCAKL